MLKSQNSINIAALLLLALLWSSSFPAIKIAVDVAGPLSLVAVRGVVGLLVVLAFIAFQREFSWRPYVSYLPFIFLLSIVGMSVPFYLISRAELVIDSSLTGLLMSVGPLMTIVGAHFTLANERLSLPRMIGVLTGFSGVLLLLGNGAATASFATIEAQIMVVVATACYTTGNLMARRMPEVPSLFITCAMLLFLVLQMVPLAVVIEAPDLTTWPARVWGGAIWLGLFSTGIAFSIRFYLIKHAGAGFTSYVGYLIPVFSLILGAVILQESLGSEKILAVILVIYGLAISQRTKVAR